MKRFGLFLVLTVLIMLNACGGTGPADLDAGENTVVEDAVPGLALAFPEVRETRELLPVHYVSGAEYIQKSPLTEASGNLLHVNMEVSGVSYALYKLIPGDDLIDHLIIHHSNWNDAPQPYFMVANYSNNDWEWAGGEQNPGVRQEINIDVASWLDCESPAGAVFIAVVYDPDPQVYQPGDYVDSLHYISLVTQEDQAREYLCRLIIDEEKFREQSSEDEYNRFYTDRYLLYSGEYLPELQDMEKALGFMPHGTYLHVVNPLYLTYSALVAYPRRDGTWGVWTRDIEGNVTLESNDYGWREATAVQTLRAIHRSEETFHYYNGVYGTLAELFSPPYPMIPVVDPLTGAGYSTSDSFLVIMYAGVEDYTARVSKSEDFTYEMHADGVITKVE